MATGIILTVWFRHGGFGALNKGAAFAATSLAQLTGVAASFAGLAGLALAARPIAVEHRYGLDRVFIWHRILGETMAVLVGVHVVASIFAWGLDLGFGPAIIDLTGRDSYMALAFVGALLIGAVTISSLRSIRRQMSYETWYFVHLLAYAGFAISFSHEIVWGELFANDSSARWLWIGLHVGFGLMLIRGRWGRLAAAAIRPLHVAETRQLNDDTTELRLAGGGLHNRHGDAGQFVIVRPLVKGLWWQAHPFSLSSAPTIDGLRISVKTKGDATAAIGQLPEGTRVVVEGPFGACTPHRIDDRKVLFIVGGIGVAPVKAMLERLDPRHQPIVLYRARRPDDLVYADELGAMARELGGELITLVGPTATLAVKDPLSGTALRKAIPDLTERVAVLCGPERLLWAGRAGLREAGVAAEDIHFEQPWW
ncbi:MAG: ferric reductase-like transmembrane domain-containing protein [Ilumatobacteraceae bacterium]|nr:ferric reductase-like transmembrane domain-containing protein [Ilumatobacteraceae bacterium]